MMQFEGAPDIPGVPISNTVSAVAPKTVPKVLDEEKSILSSAGIEIIEKKDPSTINPPKLIPLTQEESLKRIEKTDNAPKPALNALELGAGPAPTIPAVTPTKAEATTTSVEKPKAVVPLVEGIHTILAQKLSGTVATPTVKTEHSLDNITKTTTPAHYPPKADPYRLSPDE
jgi:hypothetical protein